MPKIWVCNDLRIYKPFWLCRVIPNVTHAISDRLDGGIITEQNHNQYVWRFREWISSRDNVKSAMIDIEEFAKDIMGIHDLHPWKNDLETMALMLSGEIEIPHKTDTSFIDGIKVCEDCLEAQILKNRYYQEFVANIEVKR